jgi:hypothetical protein
LNKITNPRQEVGEFVLKVVAESVGKPIRVFIGDCCPQIYWPIGKTEQCHADFINIIYRDTLLSNNGHYFALIQTPPEDCECVNLQEN